MKDDVSCRVQTRQNKGLATPFRPSRDSGCNVIFGFNTDIKHDDTVYHVQSEVREHDSLLQTQVFVKGRCLGKYATSFAQHTGPDFTEDRLHELLKRQHKHFVDCARAGTIMEEIESGRGVPEDAPPVDAPPEAAAGATKALVSSGSDGGADPFAAFTTPPPSPLAKQILGIDEPKKEEKEEEERISISLGDDPDLAAIAEASAAAIADSERRASAPAPAPLPKVDEVPAEPVERPPDPVLDSFMAELEAAEKEPPPPPLPEYRVEATGNVIGKGVGLDCLEPIVAPDGASVLLNVQVTEEGNASAGAQITCRIAVPNAPAAYLYSTSNASGIADLRVTTQGLDANTPILIQAAIRGKSASRKFNLRKG